MLFGLGHEKEVPDAAHTSLPALYNRAGNLEKSFEAIAHREPTTLLTPDQIRAYNSIVEAALQFAPNSKVLKEDAPLIEEGDQPHVETFYRVLHTAIVPTLHNALPGDNAGAALPGV